MNLRFVEAFYWAVMLKSALRAAEKLFVTQSALSRRIAARRMSIDPQAAGLKRELRGIGEKMTAEGLAQAGADGKAVIDAYRK